MAFISLIYEISVPLPMQRLYWHVGRITGSSERRRQGCTNRRYSTRWPLQGVSAQQRSRGIANVLCQRGAHQPHALPLFTPLVALAKCHGHAYALPGTRVSRLIGEDL
jgi:hypothetical protein